VKELQKVQDNLISNINIIKVGNEEALTLNNDLLENTDFLLRMMQAIDPNFMLSELKMDRTEEKVAMQASVLKESSKDDKAASESVPSHQTSGGRKTQGRNRD